MKKMIKRAAATVAAAVLGCSLVACGGGGGASSSAGSSSGAGSNSSGGNTSGGTSGGVVNGNTQGTNVQATAFAAMHWASGATVSAPGGITTYLPSLANVASGKVIAVFAQSETGGNKLYSATVDLATGVWSAPSLISGYAGVVQGVNDVGGWALSPSATVVTANPVTGMATAAWTSQVSAEATLRVWTSTYSNTSATWSAPTQIGTASASGLKITNSAGGGTLVGWLSASTVNAGTQALNLYTIPASGAPVTDLVELGATPNSAIKVGLSDTNGIVAIWAGAAQTVKLARKSGGVWAATVSLGTGAPASESDLDVAVNGDGSDAVAWAGVDPSIHTLVHDASGAQIASQLVSQGSMGNTRPALGALGSGKYLVVFAASSLSSSGFAYHEPYSSTYSPGTGWSAPIALYPGGASGAGNQQVRIDAAGDALAVNLGFNINGYALTSGVTAWTPTTNIVYGGAIPAFVQEKSTGRAVILWCSGSQLLSASFK